MDRAEFSSLMNDKLFNLSQLVESMERSMDLFTTFRVFDLTVVVGSEAGMIFRLAEQPFWSKPLPVPEFSTQKISDIREKARVLLGIFGLVEDMESQRIDVTIFSIIPPELEIPGLPCRFMENKYKSIIEPNRQARTVLTEWLQNRIAS